MASPFNVFRKNQKAMLVVFGVVLMVSFLIGGIFTGSDPMGGGGSQADEVVVSWDGGKLTDREIERLRMQRGLTVRYLATIAQKAIENGGSPKGPGVVVDQRGQISSVGIPQDTSDRSIVHSRLMHDKAEAMGFTVTDADVSRFLGQVSDESISSSELQNILQRVAGDRLTEESLYNSLKYELLARKLETLGSQSGVFFNTPGEQWQQFNRLNRQIEVELIEVPVEDFVSEVPEPTKAQLMAFFEEHKNQEPHPAFPDPGFRQRRKLAFAYFEANLEQFMEGPDGELAKVTDKEIEDYYEENKDASFRATELPELEDEPAAPEVEATDPEAEPAPAQPESTEPETTEPDTAEPESTPPESTEPPAIEPTANEPPANEPAADPVPPAETPAPEEAPADDSPEPAAPAEDDPAPADDPASDTDASDTDASEAVDDTSTSNRARRSVNAQFATFQQDADSDDTATADNTEPQPADDADPPTDEAAPADAPAPAAAPAEEPSTDDPPATPEPTEEPAAPAEPEVPAAEPAAEPAEPQPTTQPPADPAIEPASTADVPAEEPKPKYTPLEKVRDEIRRSIAQPRAFERMQKSLEEAEARVQPYGLLAIEIDALSKFADDENAARDLAEKKKQFEKERPDYEAIAAELNLTYGEIPLVDQFEVADYPLGQVTTFDRNTFQQISFAAIAFGAESVTPYKVRSIGAQFRRDDQFLFWVTDESEARVPEFADVYNADDKTGPVVDAWKLQQALPLAEAHAQKLAEEANQSDQLMEEQFKGREDITVLKSNPFSWLTTGGMFSFGQVQLGTVAGVEMAGSDFMESVFSLNIGEAGVAVNQPRTKVYVVNVVGQMPSNEALQTQFAMSQFGGDRMQAQILGQVTFSDRSQAYQAWLDDVEREMEVKWTR